MESSQKYSPEVLERALLTVFTTLVTIGMFWRVGSNLYVFLSRCAAQLQAAVQQAF